MKNEITFFCENVKYIIRNKKKLRNWISHTIELEGAKVGILNFILCNDDFLSELNIKYLEHDTLTDILTFSFIGEDEWISGDIFISIQRIKENSIEFNQKVEEELHRVMIHGILHLLGYNDLAEIEKLAMREKENFYIELFRLANWEGIP